MHLYIYYDRRAESWKGCTLGSEALDSSREVNEARGGLMLAAGRVRPKKKKTKKNTEKSAPPPKNTPRNPQQPCDRIQLEMACEETRHTR